MSELAAGVEDWSLQAIVGGSSIDFAQITVDMGVDGQDPFSDMWTGFSDIIDLSTTGSADEVEELYGPFYTADHGTYELPSHTVIDFQGHPKLNISTEEGNQPGQDDPAGVPAGYTPKYKKRKSQQKRVAIQVTAEGLSADKWAWRKYGQKPIKGSPYPRSYYRCSSSKGCLARKQVEQSCNDPGLFIVTYTAEHSHSQPTRRNSLAGTVRHKNPNPPTATKMHKTEPSCNTPQTHHLVLPDQSTNAFYNASIKQGNEEEIDESRVVKVESFEDFGNDIVMSDEDFLSTFTDFEDGFSIVEPHFVGECGWF